MDLRHENLLNNIDMCTNELKGRALSVTIKILSNFDCTIEHTDVRQCSDLK